MLTLSPSVLIAKMGALVFSRRKDLKTQHFNNFTSFTIPGQTARGKAVKEEVENRGRKCCANFLLDYRIVRGSN